MYANLFLSFIYCHTNRLSVLSPEALPPTYFVCACADALERNSNPIQAKKSNCLVSGEYFLHHLDKNLFPQITHLRLFCLFRKYKSKYFRDLLSALNKSEILVESLRRDPICISGFRSFEVHPLNRSVLSILSYLMKPCYFRRTNLKWHALPAFNASISHEN